MLKHHIVFFGNDLGYFFTHRLPVAKAALEKGYRVSVIAPENKEVAKRLESLAIDVHAITMHRKSMNPLSELATLYQLVGLCKRIKPDAIHNVTIKPVVYGNIAAIFAGVPVRINAITGLGYVFINQTLKAKLIRFLVTNLYRLILNRPYSRTIFQNPDDREQFIRSGFVSEEKSYLIKGSGVDTDEYKLLDEPKTFPIKILLAARMLKDKGVLEFVEAARNILKKRSDVQFILAGGVDEGNPAAIDKAVLESWQKEGVVVWKGHSNEMMSLYADSHIVCLPSYREGLPRMLIEAASCGRPIVTTDVPGCREIVEHEVNGLLVPEKDSGALAAALLELIDDKKKRKSMGKTGRKLVEKELHVNAVIQQTLAIYEECFAALGSSRK